MDNIFVGAIGTLALQVLVWASYLYIGSVYTLRLIKYARMPVHLRWELYPVPHEKGQAYGGSYLEEPEWWKKPREKSLLKDIAYMVKDYLFFGQYFERNKGYWAVLYPWHISFYLIVGFHGLVAFSVLFLLNGVEISAGSPSIIGQALYYAALTAGVAGFAIGCVGSIAVLIERLTDADLRAFAAPRHYFSYLFYLGVFLSGLVAWLVADPTFSGYREFYRSVLTFHIATLEPALVVHAVFFALFLFYMPYTKAFHYGTKLIAFFAVRWSDTPNLRGSSLERQLQKNLGQTVTWSAPHIQSGKKWSEVATELPFLDETGGKK